MKKASGFAAAVLFFSQAAFAEVVADWNHVTPGMDTGAFADTLGSKVEFAAEKGPDGGQALRIRSTLVPNGWGGVWHGISEDLSRNKSLEFKVKTSAPG